MVHPAAGVNQRGAGYIDGDLFMRWLQHIITIAGCTLESRHILLLDGHVSHKTLDALEFARARDLHLVTCPPHWTHRLQPLDRTLFRCLKTSYRRPCDSWLLANRGRAITHHDVMQIFRQAYVNSAIMQFDGPQNDAIIIKQIMLYVKDLIIVDTFLEDLIV